MWELHRRISALVERIRAGEGAHVLADLGETVELWLKSGLVPMPSGLRPRAESLGALVGELARAARPAPVDVPPPAAARGSARPAERRPPVGSVGPSTSPAAPAASAVPERPQARTAEPSVKPEPRAPAAKKEGAVESPEAARAPKKPEAVTTKEAPPELIESIAASGLFTPPVLIPGDSDGYRIVTGFARLEALQRLHYHEVEARVVPRNAAPAELLFFAISENAWGRGLNVVEQAIAHLKERRSK